ncbi:phosphoenolpyruvate--protein phosphotransferase [Sphingomonas sp. LR60]|uniref:phosphoenolpyruvate--protein phosphotransferase n=1 Tax=Sphingomonas sp. LR60 TaxID=3050233 RepID=UPI002FE2F14D
MASLSLYAPLEGWACSLDDVPDAVFAERMLGDGVAIDPTGDTLTAPCDAQVITVQPTGHAITLRTAEGAELLIHIGLDTVGLKGEGFETLVVAGDAVTRGQPLIRFDLDRIVCEARAAVTPIVVTNGDRFTIAHRATGAIVASGDPLMTLTLLDAQAQQAAGDGPSALRTIVVPLPHGIHARPAARIAEVARGFDASVTLAKDGDPVGATSPIGLLSLIVAHNDRVTIAATGAQAAAAVEAVAELILHGIKEDAAPTPPRPTSPAPRDVPAGAIAGVTAAPGLAIGTVARWDAQDLDVPRDGCGIAAEEAAFTQACTALSAELTGKAAAASGPMRAILDAHAAMLSDDALLNTARAGIAEGQSAAYAWRAAIRPQADALRAGSDPRLAERADDMRDLERQLIARLMGVEDAGVTLPDGAILVAEDLLPSQFMALDLDRLAGLAIVRGGPTSHVSILAAARGVPTLVALGDTLRDVAIGTRVILDAGSGWLHPAPSLETLADAEARVTAATTRRADALARATEECRTADGTRIELFANCGSPADAEFAVRNGAEGCGLLRTELLFLDRETAPDVAEQTADYQAVVDALDGRPLIVRLLDIGGDKPAPYLPILGEENPALGLRGVRVVLAHPQILEDQLKAILAVRPLGRCRIMVPMIAGVDELLKVRAVLDTLTGGARDVELGVMVETPAAAIGADLLAAEADFLSIGTNDLTQYTLAMDRGNAAVAGALDGLHPAVLRLIGETVRGGALRHRWTGVCGSLASDPLAVPILLGLGVTELSVAPAAVPEIKALVRDLDLAAARDHARAALACPDANAVRRLAREFAR